MKNFELVRLMNGIQQVSQLKGVKFAYALVKNKQKINQEFDFIKQTIESNQKEFAEFDKKRNELCVKFSKKDAKGIAIIENNNFIIEGKEAFNAALDQLKAMLPDEAEKYDTSIKEYESLMNDECKIEFFKIKITDIPSDITASQMEMIEELIEF